ncbi:GMC oxidoreductase [Brevundimonas sp. TWP2-3-4b1]|uniref:GMC oxidoreductase n=1 Tax=Brevundimonas sp. TWP2-3-4b1 TaxID=2804580 RepID=UPI003CF707E9
MIDDLELLGAATEIDADICIVGGGAVGLSLGVKLAEMGVVPLIIESGGISLESDSQELSDGDSVGHPFNSLNLGRYRVLGGSTTFWGGQLHEFDPILFEARPWLGISAWPISSEALRRYYDEAYTMLGVGNAERFDADVWRRIGNLDPSHGEDLDLVLSRWVPTRNLARHYLPTLKAIKGPRVIVHATMTQLDINPSSPIRLTFKSLSGQELLVKAKKVVLACGSIEIARILLAEARRDPTVPWARNPWVGTGFADHIVCDVGTVEIHDYKRFHDLFDSIYLGKFRYYPKLRSSNSAQRRLEMPELGAHFVFDNRFSSHLDNIKLFVRSLLEGRLPSNPLAMLRHVLAVASISLPLIFRYFKDRRSFKPHDGSARLEVFSEQLPCAASSVTLADRSDVFGNPLPRLSWALDGREVRSIRIFAEQIAEALAAKGLADVAISPDLLQESPEFLDDARDNIHHMCTARMSHDATGGVVDANLRVFGTENLYVAGAAVFPSTGFSNPTFTAIALALRLADDLVAS